MRGPAIQTLVSSLAGPEMRVRFDSTEQCRNQDAAVLRVRCYYRLPFSRSDL